MTENCCLCGAVLGKEDAGSTLTEATKQDPKVRNQQTENNRNCRGFTHAHK